MCLDSFSKCTLPKPIDMNEALLKEAQKNQNKILDVYSKSLKLMDESSSISLPIADITSQDTLSKSLGMLEKLGEGFALAMDDDFNSRNAVAKVLGAIRNPKTLDSIPIEDKGAFASYAVDWLENCRTNSRSVANGMLYYQSHRRS